MLRFYVGFCIDKSFGFIINDFRFSSGLLLLVLLSLVDQPFFSKDSNIFVNAVTAALSLLLVQADDRSAVFWVFLTLVTYLIISSYLLMWLRNRDLKQESAPVQFFSRLNRQIGRPETVFSAFFLWGAARQFGLNSEQFNALLWFWAIFIVLNIPTLAATIENLFKIKKLPDSQLAVGKIFGVQSKNTFLVQLLNDRKQSLRRFDFVEFLYSIDEKEHIGIILDVYLLDQAQWVKVLTTPEIDALFEKTIETHAPDYIYEEPNISDDEYIIGHIPGTNYPAIINRQLAVMHHTAILGITGSGKSVFARNLIRQIANDGTKVIIVDLTGEYKEKIQGLSSIVSEDDSTNISNAIEILAQENAKFANQRNPRTISDQEEIIKKGFKDSIEAFLKGDANKTVFELSDITNNVTSLDYTTGNFSTDT